jgi:nicotinate-nucleotide pyrophosphorylase
MAAPTEASGASPARPRRCRRRGVDLISSGWITHFAPGILDLGPIE